ncbi:hypothetical protein CkaCkLH20_02072 [Colletotrichum karsti]|uniref:Uncharacterized protein n=1 Tax=Colletotrichum karsti TaxID=1095194 RepID=A0A9P6IAG5_9PEZI|nr:uncharacterized protein CkaCkLH20_02072 [Colletotrichum karsti]KAF9880118.1 hypothetical protein CkaCkLH20_02072 [Colletotrichum karsti]
MPARALTQPRHQREAFAYDYEITYKMPSHGGGWLPGYISMGQPLMEQPLMDMNQNNAMAPSMGSTLEFNDTAYAQSVFNAEGITQAFDNNHVPIDWPSWNGASSQNYGMQSVGGLERPPADLNPHLVGPLGHGRQSNSFANTQSDMPFTQNFGVVNRERDALHDRFLAFIDSIKSDSVSMLAKKSLFGAIVEKVLPYRYADGDRQFPSASWYDVLMHNEPDVGVKTFVSLCSGWFRQISANEADHYASIFTSYNETLHAGPTLPAQPQPRLSCDKSRSQRSAKTARITEHQNESLTTKLQEPLTLHYQGLIEDMDQASSLDAAYKHHFRRDFTPREHDSSWPTTREMSREYVKKLHDAILDTSCFQEKLDAIEKKAQLDTKAQSTGQCVGDASGPTLKRKRSQSSPKKYPGLSATASIYANPDSTPTDVLRAAARCELTNIEDSAQACQQGWELKLRWSGESCPAWEKFDTFEDRWNEICTNMRNLKSTLHSALGGDWISRLAASPTGERKRKQENKALNKTRDAQNELGRDIQKRQKAASAPTPEPVDKMSCNDLWGGIVDDVIGQDPFDFAVANGMPQGSNDLVGFPDMSAFDTLTTWGAFPHGNDQAATENAASLLPFQVDEGAPSSALETFDSGVENNLPGLGLLSQFQGTFDAPSKDKDALLNPLDQLWSDQIPIETQKYFFGAIIHKVLPYRFNDGLRPFPPIEFYRLLLHNEPCEELKEIVEVYAGWLGRMSTAEADYYVKVITNYYQSIENIIVNNAASLSPQVRPAVTQTKAKTAGKSVRVAEHQDELLRVELEKPLIFEYRGLIKDLDNAALLDKAYTKHYRRIAKSPKEDATWPVTKEQRERCAKQMHDAILDTSLIEEKQEALQKWQAKMEKVSDGDADARADSLKRKRGKTKPKRYPGLGVTDSVYIDLESTPAELLRAAARCDLSNIERSALNCQQGWELKLRWAGDSSPGWEPYETFEARWDQMCHNMRHRKTMLHSALRDDWVNRLATGPLGEWKRKIGNKSLNNNRNVQNELGRQLQKRHKTISEDCMPEKGSQQTDVEFASDQGLSEGRRL